jgi:hypothetical protein
MRSACCIFKQKTANVVDRNGRIFRVYDRYGFFGHAIGETNEDMKGLMGTATRIAGPGLFLPSRHAALVRRCLNHGLRVVQPLTLNEPGFTMNLRAHSGPRSFTDDAASLNTAVGFGLLGKPQTRQKHYAAVPA